MLGLHPAPSGATLPATQVYSAPLPGAVLCLLGFVALVLLALMPSAFGGWLSTALVGAPLAVGGVFGVVMGYVALSTRIGVAHDGLSIAAPGWRACPCPPVRQCNLAWTEVRAVRHRTEIYRIGPLPLRLPLEAYAIATRGGLIRFGSYYLSELEPVLINVASRADCPWHEDDEVEADLLRTLLFGSPPWPDRAPARPARPRA